MALQSLGESRPDGIILDPVMPELDAMEFLMQVRKLPGVAGVPIIVLSTSYLGDLLVDTLGVRAAVSKPFELDHLLAVIRRVFGEGADA